MTRDQYLVLYEKYLTGEATPKEKESLMHYKDEFELYRPSDGEQLQEIHIQARKRILDRLNQNTKQQINGRPLVIKWLSAAAAIIILGVAGSLFLRNREKTADKNNKIVVARHDIAPGTNKATLTLANGKKISLTDAANGTITRQGNIIVKKKKDGMLEYEASSSVHDNEVASLNTIVTPRGGQYLLVLPDGTKVWLNSASSLKFPTIFTGKERNVELSGEAYFEVAKNKEMPFKVKFNNSQIEVLGTHFDIKSYNDDEEAKATLIEGSIKVTKDNEQRILSPGQQVVESIKTGRLTVTSANIEEELAWKNGFFIFHDTNIQSIMRTAARWYDIEVTYRGNITNKQFGGRISKYKDISALLKNLELTGTIHFTIEGRRVTVIE